jgi:hypothetical protein
MAFEALHAIPEVRIAAAMRVPPIIAGLSRGLARSTFANFREARLAFTQDTLVPLWRICAGEVTANLLVPDFGNAAECRYDTRRVSALQEDTNNLWTRVINGWDSDLLMRNEARRALGYKEIQDGDVFKSESTPAPLPAPEDDEGDQGANPDDEPPKDQPPDDQPETGPEQEEPEDDQQKQAPGQPQVVYNFNVTGPLELSAADRQLLAKQVFDAVEVKTSTVKTSTAIERQIVKAVRAYLKAEYKKAEEAVRNQEKAAPVEAMDDGTEIRRLMASFYQRLVGRAYEDAAIELELDLAFDLDNPRVQEVLHLLGSKITRIADTTRAEIRVLVGRQAAEGWSLDELADQIALLAEIRSMERGTAIARTESATAQSKGSILAWRDSGVVSGMRWIVGPNPCPICEDLDGKVVALDEMFADDIDHPPAHPSCTCAVVAVLA